MSAFSQAGVETSRIVCVQELVHEVLRYVGQ